LGTELLGCSAVAMVEHGKAESMSAVVH